MTTNCYFLTMPKLRTIALLAYDGFQLLDVTGPVSVFAAANRERKHRVYDVVVVSAAGGSGTGDRGGAEIPRARAGGPASGVDTLLVAGAEESALRAVFPEPAVRRWVPRCASHARRVGSVCS